MDALETLLRPLAALLNRQLRSQTPARELCGELDGSVLAVRVRDSSLAMYMAVDSGEILLTHEYAAEPDAMVTGSLLDLSRLASTAGEVAIRDGSVELGGNPDVARNFQQLLRLARPDPEEELSGIVGDVVAHTIGDFARNTKRWINQGHATMLQNISEYLQEESRAVPSRYESDSFTEQVETFRDDIARFEARLKILEEHQKA